MFCAEKRAVFVHAVQVSEVQNLTFIRHVWLNFHFNILNMTYNDDVVEHIYLLCASQFDYFA